MYVIQRFKWYVIQCGGECRSSMAFQLLRIRLKLNLNTSVGYKFKVCSNRRIFFSDVSFQTGRCNCAELFQMESQICIALGQACFRNLFSVSVISEFGLAISLLKSLLSLVLENVLSVSLQAREDFWILPSLPNEGDVSPARPR